MNTSVPEFDLHELLEAEGADFGRGKRPLCPKCGTRGTLSVDLGRGLYCCFHAGCTFRGNARQLAHAQGRLRQVTPPERRKQRQRYDEASRGAAWLYAKSRARRLELYEAHRSLLRILACASLRLKTEPESETAWAGLAFAYRELPQVRAELAILEDSPAGTLLQFLRGSVEERAGQITQVLLLGDVTNWEGKFVSVEY